MPDPLDDLDHLSRRLSARAAAMVTAFRPGLGGPDAAARLAHLGAAMANKGLRGDAARVCVHVLARFPAAADAGLIARTVLAEGLPFWHLPLLRDPLRAELYAARLEQAMRPDMVVLDIGTGSGLLAMLAARAGAAQVIACEQEPALAAIAEENIRRNGFGDRVRVIAKPCRALEVGIDLPRRADLMVSEIVDNALLGEHVLETVADARARLLAPGAIAIPESGMIHVAAAEAAVERTAIAPVAGIDVSAMDYIRPVLKISKSRPIVLATTIGDLFRFDLSGAAVPPRGTAAVTLTSTRTAARAELLQWMSLDLGGGISLDSGPGSKITAWGITGVRSPRPITLKAGDALRVHGEYTNTLVRIWPEV